MRYVFLILTITCSSFTGIHPQQKSANTYHPFSGAVVFSAGLGGSYPYTEFAIPELDLFGRGLVEYYFSSKSIHAVGIRFLSGGGFISGEGELDNRRYDYRTSIFFMGGGIAYALRIGNGVPYASATVSYLRFDPRNKEGDFLYNNRQRNYDPNAIMYSAELGIRFPFEDILSLNLGLNINFTNTDYLDDMEKGLNNDAFATAFLGISLYIGAKQDTDGDGVEDNKDICPDTPIGLDVDKFGCPLDSDSDGVPDYLDKCNDTPKNILIDEVGCPIDSDEDGVPDYLDKCPNTPKSSHLVDVNGCTLKQSVIDADIKMNPNKNLTEQNGLAAQQEYDLLNEKFITDVILTDGNLFCLQIGSFRNKNNADKKVESLILAGHTAFIVEAFPFNNSQLWYQVRIGFFNSFEKAEAYKEKFFHSEN